MVKMQTDTVNVSSDASPSQQVNPRVDVDGSNVVHGKRRRRQPQRFTDTEEFQRDWVGLILEDIPDDELKAALEDSDAEFDLSSSEDEADEEGDDDDGTDLDDFIDDDDDCNDTEDTEEEWEGEDAEEEEEEEDLDFDAEMDDMEGSDDECDGM